MPADATVSPGSVLLAPGESVEVLVTVEGAPGDSGKLFFPARTVRGQVKATLQVDLEGSAVFLEPENPNRLPVQIEKISEDATSARYRLTADSIPLTRREKRRLSR